MGEKLQTTYPLKVHNIFIHKKCILVGRVLSTKVVQRIVKFQIWHFAFFFFFVNMGPYESECFIHLRRKYTSDSLYKIHVYS